MLPRLFDSTGSVDVARAGAKAATLTPLARAGMPVPDGFIVEADRFAAWHASEDQTRMSLGLSGELTIAIERYFGDAAVAVRSSAVDEDQAEPSFAGQYTSFVNIRGAAAIE